LSRCAFPYRRRIIGWRLPCAEVVKPVRNPVRLVVVKDLMNAAGTQRRGFGDLANGQARFVSGGHCPDTLAVGVIKPRDGKTQATFELNLTMNSLPQCIWRLHSSIQQIECDLSSKLDSLADIYTPIYMAALECGAGEVQAARDFSIVIIGIRQGGHGHFQRCRRHFAGSSSDTAPCPGHSQASPGALVDQRISPGCPSNMGSIRKCGVARDISLLRWVVLKGVVARRGYAPHTFLCSLKGSSSRLEKLSVLDDLALGMIADAALIACRRIHFPHQTS